MTHSMIDESAYDRWSATPPSAYHAVWIAARLPVVVWLCLAWCAQVKAAPLTCSPADYTNNPYVGWAPGDCNGNPMVAVNELVALVGTALGQAPGMACPAGDRNGDGTVRINEIVSGVTAALGGCPPAWIRCSATAQCSPAIPNCLRPKPSPSAASALPPWARTTRCAASPTRTPRSSMPAAGRSSPASTMRTNTSPSR